MNTQEAEWMTAVHEAAHVVAFRSGNIEVRGVDVVPDGNRHALGHVHLSDAYAVGETFFANMVALYAGKVADMIYNGMSDAEASQRAESDFAQVEVLLLRASLDDEAKSRLQFEAMAESLSLIHEKVSEIEHLANALLVKKSMSGEEVNAVLGS